MEGLFRLMCHTLRFFELMARKKFLLTKERRDRRRRSLEKTPDPKDQYPDESNKPLHYSRTDAQVGSFFRKWRRPSAAEIQGIWDSLLDLWEDACDEERTEILSSVVKRVEIKEKRPRACGAFAFRRSSRSNVRNN